MKSEYAANVSLQTKHQGFLPIAKKQGKSDKISYDTLAAMLQSYLTKFAALFTLALTIKHFI